MPILELENLSKTYPGQRALDRAFLRIDGGHIHALVGQNGSGKSTLIKLLAGYVKADRGYRATLNGERVNLWSMPPELRRHVHVVHQDLGLVPTLSTVENLALGRGFHTSALGHIRWRHEARLAQELLLQFGVSPDVRAPVGTLSAAEQSFVAIGRALQRWDDYGKAVLFLDEPTASLSRSEVEALFRALRTVASRGAGVVFVTHRLDEVYELGDTVTVLRDGRVVHAGPLEALPQEHLIEKLIGERAASFYQAPPTPRRQIALEVVNLVGPRIRGIDIRVHAGEILGVAGLVGSGRDELAPVVFGALPRFTGRVLVDKRKVFATPRDSIAAGVALVPADRPGQGMIARHRVREHLTLPNLAPLRRVGGRIDRKAEAAEAHAWVEAVEIAPPWPELRLEKLSGGNQQKAVLARWLRLKPRVLLLDEATQGVDVGARATIYRLIVDAAATGVAVLMCSSDAEELAHLCDRVIVLRAGRKVADLSGTFMTPERIVAETLGATSRRGAVRVRHRESFTLVRR